LPGTESIQKIPASEKQAMKNGLCECCSRRQRISTTTAVPLPQSMRPMMAASCAPNKNGLRAERGLPNHKIDTWAPGLRSQFRSCERTSGRSSELSARSSKPKQSTKQQQNKEEWESQLQDSEPTQRGRDSAPTCLLLACLFWGQALSACQGRGKHFWWPSETPGLSMTYWQHVPQIPIPLQLQNNNEPTT